MKKVGGVDNKFLILNFAEEGCEGGFVQFNSFLKNEHMTPLWFKNKFVFPLSLWGYHYVIIL